MPGFLKTMSVYNLWPVDSAVDKSSSYMIAEATKSGKDTPCPVANVNHLVK